MPFDVATFAKMYIADKTTVNCTLDFTEMSFVHSADFTPGRWHPGTLMSFHSYAWVIRSNKNWINLCLIFAHSVRTNQLLA